MIKSQAMKNLFSILSLLLFTNLVIAQTEKAIYKSVVDSFEINYNADKLDAIFASFSPEMQQALPLDKTKEFFAGLKTVAGKITQRTFVNYQQSYASYKTNFERALYSVNISVDNHAKINGLFVKPFQGKQPAKN